MAHTDINSCHTSVNKSQPQPLSRTFIVGFQRLKKYILQCIGTYNALAPTLQHSNTAHIKLYWKVRACWCLFGFDRKTCF